MNSYCFYISFYYFMVQLCQALLTFVFQGKIENLKKMNENSKNF